MVPNSTEVTLVCLRQLVGIVQVELRTCQPDSVCPSCGKVSSRVHSKYRRQLHDLPWQGLPVNILLWTRRFFCVNERCMRKIFTERLPGTVDRYARRSSRSSESLRWLALALGGRAGSRLALKLGLLASGATLLRQLRQRSKSPSAAPRVLGIDEWAWKKGHRYGTILCDLERGTVVDLLPTRDTAAVAAWLSKHPTVEVVSRDRACSFADAIRRGAPEAVQVADRWHLLNNLFEVLTRSLDRYRPAIRAVSDGLLSASPVMSPIGKPTLAVERKQQRRESRLQLYQEAAALIQSGVSQSEASRRLGVSVRTIQRWTACGVFPERKRRDFPSSVNAFAAYLSRRVAEGCTNVSQLWREIREQGFDGQLQTVWNWLRLRFGRSQDRRGSTMLKRSYPLSPKQLAWLMLKVDTSRSKYLTALSVASAELASIARVAKSLFDLLRNRDCNAWTEWIEAAKRSPLASFAKRLERDKDAVLAALRLPWNNGMVEGHIHRLKLIKRQMYGRAGFDLLRERVLNAA